MDKQFVNTVSEPTGQTAPSPAEITRDVTRGTTWQECEINAEDCRIKAEQQPSLRDSYLAQAAYWDLLKEKLV